MKHLLETKRKVMRMRKKKSSVNKGEKSLIKSVVVLYVRVLLAALDGPPLCVCGGARVMKKERNKLLRTTLHCDLMFSIRSAYVVYNGRCGRGVI